MEQQSAAPGGGAAASSSTFGSRFDSSWSVHHDEYQGRADAQLVEYLRHLRMWSRFEARHDVITISLDLKAQARNRRQFLAGSTPPSRSSSVVTGFTPAELMGSASSLVAGAMASGWPTLEELRGRFILVLSGDEPTKASYAGSGRNRLCFADQRLGDGDARLSLTEGPGVLQLNATEDWDWHGAPSMVRPAAGVHHPRLRRQQRRPLESATRGRREHPVDRQGA